MLQLTKEAVVYSTKSCPWCDRAVKLLESNGYTVNKLIIGDDVTMEQFNEVFPEARTVPRIVIKSVAKFNNYAELATYFARCEA